MKCKMIKESLKMYSYIGPYKYAYCCSNKCGDGVNGSTLCAQQRGGGSYPQTAPKIRKEE